MTIPVAVLATRHRAPLVVPHLLRAGVKFDLRLDPEPDLPKGWAPLPQFERLTPNNLRMMRCHEQHVAAVAAHVHRPGDVVLVLEDDAVPVREDFMAIAEAAAAEVSPGGDATRPLAMFLCADIPDETPAGGWDFKPWRDGLTWMTKTPRSGPCHHGTQSMIYGYAAQNTICQLRYTGLPIDCLLGQWLGRMAWIRPNVFFHDRSQGSMMEPEGHGVLTRGER